MTSPVGINKQSWKYRVVAEMYGKESIQAATRTCDFRALLIGALLRYLFLSVFLVLFWIVGWFAGFRPDFKLESGNALKEGMVLIPPWYIFGVTWGSYYFYHNPYMFPVVAKWIALGTVWLVMLFAAFLLLAWKWDHPALVVSRKRIVDIWNDRVCRPIIYIGEEESQ